MNVCMENPPHVTPCDALAELSRQVTHPEGEIRCQRRSVEIFKDGVLEVWELQTCRHTRPQLAPLPVATFGLDRKWEESAGALTFVTACSALLHFLLHTFHLLHHVSVPLLRLLQFTAGQNRDRQTDEDRDGRMRTETAG